MIQAAPLPQPSPIATFMVATQVRATSMPIRCLSTRPAATCVYDLALPASVQARPPAHRQPIKTASHDPTRPASEPMNSALDTPSFCGTMPAGKPACGASTRTELMGSPPTGLSPDGRQRPSLMGRTEWRICCGQTPTARLPSGTLTPTRPIPCINTAPSPDGAPSASVWAATVGAHLLWDKTDGTASLWSVDTTSGAYTHEEAGPFSGYTANAVASGTSMIDLLWTNVNGTAAGVRFRASGADFSQFGPFSGYSAVALSVGSDDGAHLLWDKTDGTAALWNVDFSSGAFSPALYGPFSGWTARAIATSPDGATYLLWDNVNGQISLWDVMGNGHTHTEYGPYAGWTAAALSAGP